MYALSISFGCTNKHSNLLHSIVYASVDFAFLGRESQELASAEGYLTKARLAPS